MKNVRSCLALLTSMIVASLISFALGITSTLWYLQPVMPGAPMTAASATTEQDGSSGFSPPMHGAVDDPPVKTASEIPRSSPQQLSTLSPSAGPNIAHGGGDGAKMERNLEKAASQSVGAAAETATASASSASSPAPTVPRIALPASSNTAEAAVREAAPGPSITQPAPAKKSAQVAPTADPTKRRVSSAQSGRHAVFQLQLGAFLNAGNANRFQRDLNMQGFPVKVSPKTDRQGRVWQVARLGAYSNRLTAMEAAARFRRDTGLEAIVMKNTPINEG